MRKVLAFFFILTTNAVFANQSYEGTWEQVNSYLNENGDEISDVLTLDLYSDGCYAYSETLENGNAVTGGKLDCYFKNNFVKISSWGSIIAQGLVEVEGNQLILTYKSRAYNRHRDEDRYYFDRKVND